MKNRSLLRVTALQMVLVFVIFFVVPVEAWERGGGGFSREGQARGGRALKVKRRPAFKLERGTTLDVQRTTTGDFK
jgi:hypothetical protein